MFNYHQYVQSYTDVLQRLDRAMLEQFAQTLFRAWQTRRTVFVCGNGGNGATASHLVTDLIRLTQAGDGPRLRAVALGDNAPGFSAVANDLAYDDVFVEPLRTFLEPSDVVIGLSTSGSSPNVLRAVDYGRTNGAVTIGITGLGGDALRTSAAHTLVIPSHSTQQLEDATGFVGHLLCLRLRDLMADTDTTRYAGPTSVPYPSVAG